MEEYELAVVGCGPAGMSAALNVKIRKKTFVLLGTPSCAEKLRKAPQIDNYLGMPAIKGEELLKRFSSHLEDMDIQVQTARVTNIYRENRRFSLVSGEKFLQAKSIILATGVAPTKLIPGEEELLGKGAGYCATCDGPLYRGKRVAVIAYHREAEEEANYLAGICREVIYIPQYPDPGTLNPKITLKRGKPVRIAGAEAVSGIELGEERIPVDGVFILRETMPAEQLLPGLELRDGTISVDREMQTNIPGVFAAGDCTGKPYQLAKAVGEGATAALSAVRYLDNLGEAGTHTMVEHGAGQTHPDLSFIQLH